MLAIFDRCDRAARLRPLYRRLFACCCSTAFTRRAITVRELTFVYGGRVDALKRGAVACIDRLNLLTSIARRYNAPR